MTALADMTSSGEVVLIAPDVLRDIAASLSGLWAPEVESDPGRREAMVAAARIRLYGDRDRCGWYLVTTAQSRDAVLRREDADWNVGFIPALESFDDAPNEAEVDALVSLFRDDEHIDAEAARALAMAILCEAVTIIVSRDVRAFKHNRAADLPERLELLEPWEVAGRLEIGEGEQPPDPVPDWSLLSKGPAWWVPS
ncbi:MAG: hypothetical protein R2726_05820 [Acidimicrobiales bacterium]